MNTKQAVAALDERAPVPETGPILRAMARNKVRFGLIVLEVALTLAIVVNCVSLIVDARGQMARPSGFDDQNLVSVTSRPFDPAFRDQAYCDASVVEDVAALRRTPGVRAVTVTYFRPWQGGGSSTLLRPQGAKAESEALRVQIYPVSEQILDTLGVGLVEGRALTADDVARDTQRLRDLANRPRDAGGKPTEKFVQDVMVTEAYAKLAFGPGPWLGKALEDSDGDLYRVIGIVDRFYNPYSWPIHEYAVFYGHVSSGYDFGVSYLVRLDAGWTPDTLRSMEDGLEKANAGRTLRVRTIEEVKANYFGTQQMVSSLMAGVIVLLIGVTSLGIVGLASFAVTERTRQIGTRRALGARQFDILRHFLLENGLVTALGVAIGTLLAFAINAGLLRLAASARLSPLYVAIGGLFLLGTGLMATLFPALRGSRTSPAIATRNL